jgi:DNA polymerase III epsilon subunit-like protein
MVAGKPTFMEKVGSFCRYFQGDGRPADLVGHNIDGFDLPFIKKYLYKAGLKLHGNGPNKEVRMIDTLTLCRKHFHFSSNKLEDLCFQFGITHGKHRGLGDAICTWELLQILVEMMGCTDMNQLFTALG